MTAASINTQKRIKNAAVTAYVELTDALEQTAFDSEHALVRERLNLALSLIREYAEAAAIPLVEAGIQIVDSLTDIYPEAEALLIAAEPVLAETV
jgi:hypothetical protein